METYRPEERKNPHFSLDTFKARIRRDRLGFLKPEDVQAMIQGGARLEPVLVRLGSGLRFTCPAQNVDQLIGLCTKGGDYVRDCSLPVEGGAR